MIKICTAGVVDGRARCCLCTAVALLALVFLAAPAGLAHHSGAHGHTDGESGDCSLCDLESHYSIAIPTMQDAGSCQGISVLSMEGPTLPSPHEIFGTCGRAPPAFSV